MDQKAQDRMNEMLKVKKSEALLKESFEMFKIQKDNLPSRLIIFILSAFIGVIILKTEVVSTMDEIISTVMEVELGMFGVIFTGYALFQALLNESFLALMMESSQKSNEKENKLHYSNLLFVRLMMQFLLAIFISLLSKIIIAAMPNNFCLLKWIWLDDILAFVLLFFYFYQCFVILCRTIGFVSNMYHYFNAYAVLSYSSMEEKEGGQQ